MVGVVMSQLWTMAEDLKKLVIVVMFLSHAVGG